MKYLLDTNICIYLIKNRPLSIRQRFMAHGMNELGLSTITVGELQVGVERNPRREQAEFALEQLLRSITVFDFDLQAAAVYGKVRMHLERRGTPIGPLDYLLAAHALSLNATLVTNDEREFSRVPGLTVENWISG